MTAGVSTRRNVTSEPEMDAAPDFCVQEPPWYDKLRVMWIWHAAVVAEYQKPLAILGRCPWLDLTLLVPRRWPERAGQMVNAEPPPAHDYRVVTARTLFTGLYYIYLYPGLLYQLLRSHPDVIYCYEEPHTLIAACVLLLRRLFLPNSKVILYAAQNIKKRYPPPFSLFERYSFRRTDAILACGTLVGRTLRSKGYSGVLRVIGLPTDTTAFSPDAPRGASTRHNLGIPGDAFVIGYAGKLVEEKGLRTLWDAFALLAETRDKLHLVLAGAGPLRSELEAQARAANLQDKVHFPGVLHSDTLPGFMNSLDVFVLPSETRPNWREQFGRVLVEAMACGVPVIGSDSGEIPSVLGDAGLVFREGDSNALADCLRLLLADASLRAELSSRGRQRAITLFSVEKIAAQHYTVYEQLSVRSR
jgi:glycosyltransferase involved in cell wall biosynthesis